jgi:hypothetical protein
MTHTTDDWIGAASRRVRAYRPRQFCRDVRAALRRIQRGCLPVLVLPLDSAIEEALAGLVSTVFPISTGWNKGVGLIPGDSGAWKSCWAPGKLRLDFEFSWMAGFGARSCRGYNAGADGVVRDRWCSGHRIHSLSWLDSFSVSWPTGAERPALIAESLA